MTDLAAVVPDKDVEQALTGILGRHRSLAIRPVAFRILVHPNRDPGCYHTGHELLSPYASGFSHGLVLFDRAWEGAPSADPQALAADVERRLTTHWGSRARCIVIDPEVEQWVWSDSPHVDEGLGWKGRQPALRQWLSARGLWTTGCPKPPDPKGAFEAALGEVRRPASSAIFRRLAERVGLSRCVDPSFRALVTVLKEWFGTGTGASPRRD